MPHMVRLDPHNGLAGDVGHRRHGMQAPAGMDDQSLTLQRRDGAFARAWLAAAIIVTIGSLAWLGLIFTVERLRFVVHDPHAKTGFEMFLALGQLFGGLVLTLAPDEADRPRLRWVAMGLFLLGSGTLWFAYLFPLLAADPGLNVTMSGSLLMRTLGTGAIAIGLVPSVAPPLGVRAGARIMLVAATLALGVTVVGHRLPALLHGTGDLSRMIASAPTTFPGLTAWHWWLALVPAALGIAAAIGAVWHVGSGSPSGWLLPAVILLAAAQVHAIFWPSFYSSVLTTTSLLRLGMTTVVIVGGILELRAITEERGRLLATEQQRVQQLQELGNLKRDFAAMVAHELATPVTTIGLLTHIIDRDDGDAALRRATVKHIRKEVGTLHLLVEDMRLTMDVERDDFTVDLAPIPLADLICEAGTYMATMAEQHPLSVESAPDVVVLADRERIGQVLRNLLANAGRYTPPGTPITMRAQRRDGCVRIEVADAGPGIALADQARVFEKYERAGPPDHRHRAGRGLGLYLSRQILERHGSALTLASAPGQGACFSFTLQVAP
jgi:signal transduction histidine kinase